MADAPRASLNTDPKRGDTQGNPCPPVAPQGRSEANPCQQGGLYCNVADAQSWQQALRELRDSLFDLAKKLPSSQAALALEITSWTQRTNALLGEVDKANAAWIGFVRNTEVQRLLAQYAQGCSLWTRARQADPTIEPLPSPFGSWRDAAVASQQQADLIWYLALGLGGLIVLGVGTYVYRTFTPQG